MSKHVLVAEDDADIFHLVQDVLQEAGFTVSSSVGAGTLEAVRAKRPDLILMDYQMPGMDGVSIAQQIRADPEMHDIPIIAMTAATRAAMICHQMDANGCLGKPFDIDHLVASVETLLHLTH